MFRFSLLLSVVLLTSCAPKHTYYFASSGAGQSGHSSSEKSESISKLPRNDLSANREMLIYDRERIAIDTGIVSNDSLLRKKSDPPPDSLSERHARKKIYLDKRKAYIEAKKTLVDTKKKRDGFAIVGAILFTVGVLSIMHPVTALVFGSLGLIASILGLKSRIWGLSLGVIIATGAVLVLYLYYTLLLGPPGG